MTTEYITIYLSENEVEGVTMHELLVVKGADESRAGIPLEQCFSTYGACTTGVTRANVE